MRFIIELFVLYFLLVNPENFDQLFLGWRIYCIIFSIIYVMTMLLLDRKSISRLAFFSFFSGKPIIICFWLSFHITNIMAAHTYTFISEICCVETQFYISKHCQDFSIDKKERMYWHIINNSFEEESVHRFVLADFTLNTIFWQ